MDDMKTQLVTFCKAEASAVVASAADFAVTLILAELLGLWYVCATFIGAVTGGVVNCMVNYRWVFSAQRLGKMRLALRYMRALKNYRYFHFIGVVRRHYRAFTRRSGNDV